MTVSYPMKKKSQVKLPNNRGAAPLKKKIEVKPRKKHSLKFYFGTIVLILLILIILDFKYFHWIEKKISMPIKKVQVNSNYYFVSQEEIKQLIDHALKENFLFVDLHMLKNQIEAFPLIDKVGIRRIWPDELVIDITEEMPVATWNNKMVMDTEAEVFKVKNLSSFAALPKLFGPEDSKKLIMQKYFEMSIVLQKIGLTVTKITLEARGAWELELTVSEAKDEAVAVRLILGRDFLNEKLGRFISIYKSFLSQHVSKVSIVDARYTNGLAITWNMQTAAVQEQNQP